MKWSADLQGSACKEVVSDSPGLVDFAIRLVNSVFNLPDAQVMFLRNLNNRRTVKSIMLVKKFLGLVEMTSGLVNASFRLPKWQAVKMIFFAPWSLHPRRMELANILSERLRSPEIVLSIYPKSYTGAHWSTITLFCYSGIKSDCSLRTYFEFPFDDFSTSDSLCYSRSWSCYDYLVPLFALFGQKKKNILYCVFLE